MSPRDPRSPARNVPDPLGRDWPQPLRSTVDQYDLRNEDERIARIVAAAVRESDSALLARCGEGDENAWRILVRRYQNLVFSTALETGLGPDDAADVFQETWLELHRSIPRIRNPEALPRWLIVASRRLSYKVATRRRRLVPGVSRDLVDPDALQDEQVEAMRTRQRLETALEALGGKCERLLRLLFFEPDKLPYETISRRTGLAIGSIGPIRGRCIARLRRILGELT